MTFLKITRYALLSLVVLSSCNGGGEEEENVNVETPTTFGIRHDKALTDYEEVAKNSSPYNTDDYPDFSTVVHFEYSLDGSDNFEYSATGVIVNSEWILTAGHNFYDEEDQSSPAPVSGIEVKFGDDPNNPTLTRDVAELVFHPTWVNEPIVLDKANDLCLVKLSSPVTGIEYATINSSTSEPLQGTVWYAGYGDYSEQSGQNPNLETKRHAIENELDRIVSGISSQTENGTTYTGGLVAVDFDAPAGNVNSLGDDYNSPDEVVLGSGTSNSAAKDFEGATVKGDSGGPLFVRINDEWVVIGVLSGGADDPVAGYTTGGYGDISVFTRVSTSIDWINSVLNPDV